MGWNRHHLRDHAKGREDRGRFSHEGLVPAFECYENCSNAWGMLINSSLRSMVTTGEEPDKTL